MWHHKSLIALYQIILRLLADLVAFAALAFRLRWGTAAERLVLRCQIALYQERGIEPWRIDAASRVTLALLPRRCKWLTGPDLLADFAQRLRCGADYAAVLSAAGSGTPPT
jgi:hypothetical protein